MIKYFGYIYLTVDTLKNQVYIGKRQNRILIHNDKEEKWIYKTEIELYLSKNYVLGRRNNN